MRITVLLLATLLISACNATEGESPHPDGSGGDGCETTRETLDQFCGAGGAGGADGSSRCPTLDDYRAEFRCIRYGDGLGVRVDRGCGYIRIFNNGDTGDGDIHVYDEKTAELVFMALRASSPVACGGQDYWSREIGTAPDCDGPWEQLDPLTYCGQSTSNSRGSGGTGGSGEGGMAGGRADAP